MANKRKRNCWEFMNCSINLQCGAFMGAGGKQTPEGPHGGNTLGRACWIAVGTIGGNSSCKCLEKTLHCGRCDFYGMVHREEGRKIIPSAKLEAIVKQFQ